MSPKPPDEHVSRHPCILIAEDDPSSRGMLAEILHMRGMVTLEAGDGQEAVMLTFDRHPDLILLDLVMPVMDGITVARTISADPETAGTPIIAMSGMLSEDLRRSTVDAGCVAYIQKPFAPAVLIAEVERWLAAKPRARHSA